MPTTVEQLLAAGRATLQRLTPEDTHAAMRSGAQLIDIRSETQRQADDHPEMQRNDDDIRAWVAADA